jgi:cell division transport system permease protein
MARNAETYAKRRLTTAYISTVVSMILVLFMLGLFGLVLLHARKLSNYVKENIGLTLMISENAKEADIQLFQKTLDASEFVRSTKFVSKENAAKILQKELGEDFVGFLGYNPLLSSIELKVKADYANNDSLGKISSRLKQNKIVNEVFYQKSLVDVINENLRKISFFLLGFSGLLLIIAIALINNTIRLSVYSKRFLIKTMQLIGATQHFIRKPFMIKGIIQGVISAAVAIVLLIFTIGFARKQVPELIDLQDIDMFLSLFLFVIVLGVFLAWISTYFAVRKYLKIKTDNLYYY